MRTPAEAPGSEPDDVGALRTMADAVREALVDATLMAHGDEIQRLVGSPAIAANLARLEPSARHTVWNMQPDLFYDPRDTSPELTEASQARGVQTRAGDPALDAADQPAAAVDASRPPGSGRSSCAR